MKVKQKFWKVIAILLCSSSVSLEAFGQKSGCSLQCERALVVNVEGPIKIPDFTGPSISTLPAEAQMNELLDRYQQAAQQAHFLNSFNEFVIKVGESYAKFGSERLGPFGPGVEAAVGFGADRLKEYLNEETDKDVRTVLRAELDRVEAALAGRNDPDAIREAVTTVLSPRLQDVTDPNARAEFQEAGIRILAGGLDQLRSEHKVSDAETAKAIKDLAGRITRLSQETQKVMASVEQLKEELKYQQELLNQLVEANRPPPPEVIARQRSGEQLQVIGNTLIQAGNVLKTLGVDQDVYSAAMTSGTVLTIAGRAFSGTLTPDVVLEGINSILGLFSLRTDPVQQAIRDAVRQILDALAEMDRRNQERFLALVRHRAAGNQSYRGAAWCGLIVVYGSRSVQTFASGTPPLRRCMAESDKT